MSLAATQGAPVMVLQFLAPFCLFAATRAASVEISAEESNSTSTTGRGSKKGCSYLPGAELVEFRRVRPSACAVGEANRKSAAAAPAALEERELLGREENGEMEVSKSTRTSHDEWIRRAASRARYEPTIRVVTLRH